jgi:predicted ribosomally synthesized peptide with nif11-like leader
MSEEQLSALLARLKEDGELQEKIKDAADLDAAVAIANEAGFDVSKADWLKLQASETLELGDEELEYLSGGAWGGVVITITAAAVGFGGGVGVFDLFDTNATTKNEQK